MEEESNIMHKLEILKEIRLRTIQLEKMKSKIKQEVDQTDTEEKCLQDYRRETEMLMQEKMAHVEELRQIHADINAMETVIKQSEEERNRHLETAKALHHEFQPMKQLVDKLREEIGLPRLPELHEEDDKLKPDFFTKTLPPPAWTVHDLHLGPENLPPSLMAATAQQMHMSASTRSSSTSEKIQSAPLLRRPEPTHGQPTGASEGRHQASSTSGPGHSLVGGPHAPSSHGPPAHPSLGTGHVPLSDRMSLDRGPAAFRQQPPPMKSCLSCHQQIHRNAPICPLCKAKSRSRNPKKPKRKMED